MTTPQPYRVETWWDRLTRRFWTLMALFAVIAGLAAISHTLAVVVVAAGMLAVLGRFVVRSYQRNVLEPRPRRRR